MRGLKTLSLRLDAMEDNAKAVAEALSGSVLGGVVLVKKKGERAQNKWISNKTWVEACGSQSLVFLGLEEEAEAVATAKAAFGL